MHVDVLKAIYVHVQGRIQTKGIHVHHGHAEIQDNDVTGRAESKTHAPPFLLGFNCFRRPHRVTSVSINKHKTMTSLLLFAHTFYSQ